MGTKMDTNSAFNDIISGDRYKGAISSISWLTGLVDNFFIAIISFCGFFIISIVFLKSALICLYASYPRLFNNIHEIKSNLSGQRSGGPQGMFMWILSLFIPDIKAMVELDGDNGQGDGNGTATPDIKTMLMKTFVSGAVLTMVGTMIYNGYYRDLMGMLSNAGSHIFETYIYSIDLNSAIDNALEAGSDYQFNYPATAGGESKSALATEIYKKIKDYYGREYLNSTDDRWVVGESVEKYVNSTILPTSCGIAGLQTIGDAFDNPDIATIKYAVETTPKVVEDTSNTKEDTHTFYKTFSPSIQNDVASSFRPDGLANVQDKYVRISILITPKTSSSAYNDRVANLGGWKVEAGLKKDGNNYYIYLPMASDGSAASFTLNGQTCSEAKGNVQDKTGCYTYQWPGTSEPTNGTASPVYIKGVQGNSFEITFTNVDSKNDFIPSLSLGNNTFLKANDTSKLTVDGINTKISDMEKAALNSDSGSTNSDSNDNSNNSTSSSSEYSAIAGVSGAYQKDGDSTVYVKSGDKYEPLKDANMQTVTYSNNTFKFGDSVKDAAAVKKLLNS